VVPRCIRPIALAVIRRGDELLVFQGHDSIKDEEFFRPLGGGIEFGETAEQALRREIREELDVGLGLVSFLGVLENIFEYEGSPGHEIAFVFDATVDDDSFYRRDNPGVVLDDGTRVSWQPLTTFMTHQARLYPTGLRALIDH
jgi:8-oxo-dGTP pyrophosphatase MutT (NUDIX family)